MDLSKINNNLIGEYISSEKKEKAETDHFQKVLLEAAEEQNEEALREACREFESYFANQLFKEMRSTVQNGGLIAKSHGEKIFEDMLYQEYANEATKGSGIGIADMLYKQLSHKTSNMFNKINGLDE